MDAYTMAKIAAGLPPRIKSTPKEIAARRQERRERMEAEKANPPQRRLSYKQMYQLSEGKASAQKKPVQFIRAFLDEHFDKMKRREALDALVRAGINMSTARRQYQKYKTKREAGNNETVE